MMKKSLSVLLSILLLMTLIPAAVSAENVAETKFQDTQTHWAKEYIEVMTQLGLFTGTGETTFSPNQTMTRGMFITVIGRMAGVDTEEFKKQIIADGLPFDDVKPEAYYAAYVAWALKNRIVSGISEDRFAPDQEITRQEMCVMLFKLATTAKLTVYSDSSPVVFKDADKIAAWAKPSVSALSAIGIIEGYDGNFNPTGLSTRAEAATLLARFTFSLGSLTDA